MPKNVSYNKILNIIEIKTFGDVTYEELLSAVESSNELISKTGNDFILVDATEETSLPNILQLDEVSSKIPKSAKIAVIVSDSQLTLRKSEYIRSSANIRGAKVRNFTSRELAVSWLKKR